MTAHPLTPMSILRPPIAANALRFNPWASPQPAAPANGLRPSEDERGVGAVIAALMQAIRFRNADAIAGLCAPDVACVDDAPLRSGTGAAAVQAHWQPTWQAFDGPIGCDATQLQITLGADVAFGTCLLRVSGKAADGQRHTHWAWATFGLRRIDGVWRFVHQHFSQPFERGNGGAVPLAAEADAAAAAASPQAGRLAAAV